MGAISLPEVSRLERSVTGDESAQQGRPPVPAAVQADIPCAVVGLEPEEVQPVFITQQEKLSQLIALPRPNSLGFSLQKSVRTVLMCPAMPVTHNWV